MKTNQNGKQVPTAIDPKSYIGKRLLNQNNSGMKFQKSAQDLLASQKSSIDFSTAGVNGVDSQLPQIRENVSPNISPNVFLGAGKADRFGTKMNVE